MKRIKKIIVFLLVVTMLLSLSGCTKKQEASQSQAELYSENIDKTSKWLIDTIPEATIGSTGGEWLILGLSRSDIEVPLLFRVIRWAPEKSGAHGIFIKIKIALNTTWCYQQVRAEMFLMYTLHIPSFYFIRSNDNRNLMVFVFLCLTHLLNIPE